MILIQQNLFKTMTKVYDMVACLCHYVFRLKMQREKNLIPAYKDEITPCETKINKIKTPFIILVLVYFRVPIFVFSYGDFRYPVYSSGVISSFRATIFRLFVWRLFVISSYFVLSRGDVPHGVCTTICHFPWH